MKWALDLVGVALSRRADISVQAASALLWPPGGSFSVTRLRSMHAAGGRTKEAVRTQGISSDISWGA